MKDVVKTNINRPESSKRTKRRKRNMSAYYFIVILLVAGVGISLSMTLLFNVKEIQVNGETQYAAEEIISASEVNIGDNMVRLRSSEVKDRILNSLINIENVKIKKKFPDILQIEVIKSIPNANIEYESGYLLVSSKGKILEANPKPKDNLMVVKGFSPAETALGKMISSDDEQKLKIYNTICSELIKQGITKIVSVDLTDKYQITMNYDGRITVEVGNSTNLAYKLTYTQKVLSEKIEPDKKGYFIFRGTNGASFVSEEDMQAHNNAVNQQTTVSETGVGTETGSTEKVTSVESTSVNEN